jgi:POT family proton-dependent oligopeptide transporter
MINEEKKEDIAETNVHYRLSDDDSAPSYVEDPNAAGPEPTEEEWSQLREVSDAIPKSAFLVILVEFCERFTYYGLSGPFQNYVQHPNPPFCK